MRNKVLRLILGLTAIALLSGCGKSEKDLAKEYYQEELGLTEEEAEEVADFVFSDSEISGDSDKTEEDTEAEKELEHFPVSPEWKNHDITDYLIQIDDSLYETGILVEDFMKIVEASAANYTYEYNPDKLVNKGDIETVIDVYREGVLWFTIRTWNMFDGTMSLAEIPVCRIDLQDKTYEYCYFIDGRSYDEIMQMKYKDIMDLEDTLFAFENFEEATRLALKCDYRDEDNINKMIEQIKSKKSDSSFSLIRGESEPRNINNSLKINYRLPELLKPEYAYRDPFTDDKLNFEYLQKKASYSFIIDKDTSEMIKFEILMSSMSCRPNVDPALME